MSSQKKLSKLMLVFVGAASIIPLLFVENAKAFSSSNMEQLSNPNTMQMIANNNFQQYTVKPGDYLSKIAEQVYGDGSDANARKIYEANKDIIGSDWTQLRPGMVLTIPPL